MVMLLIGPKRGGDTTLSNTGMRERTISDGKKR